MNILMDISHPAHLHLIRNTYFQLKNKGHNVFVTAKNVPSITTLLKLYEIPYELFASKKDSLFHKGIFQLEYNFKLWRFVVKNKIELGFSSSFTMTQVAPFTKMDAVLLDDDDDEVEPLVVIFGHPLAKVVLSPDCVKRKTKNLISYAGFQELAYLHPNWFKPDKEVLNEVGLKEGEVFFLLRFNALKAYHDTGVKGLSLEDKRNLISILEKKGKIFITTERNIEDEFKKFQLNISQDKVHSLLYYATMFISDSQTMSSEAAILGTPAIRCNTFAGKISYLEEQEHKYELTYGFKPNESKKMFEKIHELLDIADLKKVWAKRREKLLSDKIDVTAFFIWFVENYPQSIQLFKKKSDIQYKFK